MDEAMAIGGNNAEERPTYQAPNKDSAEHGDQNTAELAGLRKTFHQN